jgi:nucleoside-diphosphate-sugar epimerase
VSEAIASTSESVRVCVTGASGFLGKALANELQRSGYQVLALSRTAIKKESTSHSSVMQTFVGSFENWQTAIEEFRPDIFISCDWSGVSKEERDSPEQNLNLERIIKQANLAAKLKVRTFLTFGSQAETAPSENRISEQCIPRPQNQYGISKIDLKNSLTHVFKNTETQLIWGRIFTVYGPGDRRESIVTRCIKDALEGKLTSIKNPNLEWSFLYIDDFTEAVLRLIQNINVPKEVNIGNELPVKLQTITNILRDIFQLNTECEMELSNSSESEKLTWIPDTRTLMNYGWEPKTPLSEGIYKTVNWWEQQKGISW